MTGALLAGLAHAADAPAQDIPEASRIAVERLLEHIHLDKTYGLMLEQASAGPVAAQVQAIRQALPQSGLTGAQQQAVLDQLPLFQQRAQANFRDFMEQTVSWETMRPLVIRAYAQNFTVAEIGDIDRFYSTPTGQKALSSMPTIMRQLMVEMAPRLSQKSVSYGQEMARQALEFVEQACQCDFPPKGHAAASGDKKGSTP
ncbi:hypothetical protein GCM10010970_14060 [Silvimonas iriomotensis]|uniref:DUF2059 domain-containing protein n=2 Tax=Silvimonas iriomotensis TaxID=449662 RepID=A0ABQ2P838_9NEIS|nr:hypothetical protein GCM10010970_14060 [Silvimonas iriomotensis]